MGIVNSETTMLGEKSLTEKMNEQCSGMISSTATTTRLCEEKAGEDIIDYPDGGLRAWLVVFGG